MWTAKGPFWLTTKDTCESFTGNGVEEGWLELSKVRKLILGPEISDTQRQIGAAVRAAMCCPHRWW